MADLLRPAEEGFADGIAPPLDRAVRETNAAAACGGMLRHQRVRHTLNLLALYAAGGQTPQSETSPATITTEWEGEYDAS